MKKLLGLLAVAPMALAACGGTAEAAATPKADATGYYLGHGKKTENVGLAGLQNDHFNVIKTEVFDNDGVISFKLNESTGYQEATLTGTQGANATWNGFDDAAAENAPTEYITQAEADAASLGLTGSAFYENTGESLRFTYEVVEVTSADIDLTDGTDDVAFEAKSNDNYGNAGFVWENNKAVWTAHLNNRYDTCDEIEAVADAEIKAWAREKDGGSGIAGSTANEDGLYIAAAITTAKAYCDTL